MLYRTITVNAKLTDNRIDVGTELTRDISADAVISHPVSVKRLSDYNLLSNKPSIEGVELIGDKTYEELNLRSITNSDIESLFQNL